MMTEEARGFPAVFVLRLGHRIPRDVRTTTHVCLTARALGAQGVYVTGGSDRRLVETVNRVSADFGGTFLIRSGMSWRNVISDWKLGGGEIIHLTAYGLPLPHVIGAIRASKAPKLVVIGAGKVPREIFHQANWNVSVTNQPMSEVSALAVFLDWFFEHKRLEDRFSNAKLRIIPSERSKRIVKVQSSN